MKAGPVSLIEIWRRIITDRRPEDGLPAIAFLILARSGQLAAERRDWTAADHDALWQIGGATETGNSLVAIVNAIEDMGGLSLTAAERARLDRWRDCLEWLMDDTAPG